MHIHDRKRFTVWITKYALTKGIVEGKADETDYNGWIRFYKSKDSGHYRLISARSWHRTEAAARQRAEEMRQAKIAALEKQIKRLKEMTF